MRLFHDHYRAVTVVGNGAYGQIRLVQPIGKPVTELLAMKQINPKKDGDSRPYQLPIPFIRELLVLHQARHPCLVRLEEVVIINDPPRSAEDFGFVMERASMDAATFAGGGVDVNELKRVALDCLSGLAHLHGLGIVHRDVKPANMLIGTDGRCKLCDYGLARFVTPHDANNMSPNVCTLTTRAPEVLVTEEDGGTISYGLPADLWSLGMSLLVMVVPAIVDQIRSVEGTYQFLHDTIGPIEGCPGMMESPPYKRGWRPGPRVHPPLRELLASAMEEEGEVSPVAGVEGLLRGMLRYTPGDRLTAAELLEHGFFKEDPPAVDTLVY